ncbi:hypothetical protein C0Q70_16322 [Pomacea canaliculata]|uniref:Uncharacterized protein n=1 Tax=Pomacea canaliculata TaxID=400727 RepID=A0A2T7NPG1_POMCA|nr:hypothetical protein C0Q70_16322 [Pomacea canaliculata]
MTNGDATSNGNGEAEIVGELGLATSHFRQRSMSDAIVHARRRRLQSSPMPMHHVLMEDVHAHVRWADEEKGSPLATSVLVSSVRPRAYSHGIDLSLKSEKASCLQKLDGSHLQTRVDTGFHSIVDALTSRNIETAVNVGMLPAIVVMGVSTNVITMVVFARQSLKDRINLCLFSLAAADAGYLLAVCL